MTPLVSGAIGSGTVLCVGLTTLDVVHQVAAPPGWGRKQRSVGGELVAGGPAANAAVTAARLLGAGSARLVTAVGAEPAAAPVYADLARGGVEVVDLAPDGWSVPVASAMVDVRNGDRTVISPGALGDRGVSEEAARSYPLDRLVDDAAVVLLDGHHPALAAHVTVLAARAGLPVVLDAGSWKDELVGVLPRVTVAACSADFQPPGKRRAGDDPVGAATVLHRLGVPTVLITDGPRPVAWSTMDGARGTVPVPAVRVVDTLGAGDVFHGALAAAMAVRLGPVGVCAELAAEVAAARCARLGARAWLDAPEVDQFAQRLRVGTARWR